MRIDRLSLHAFGPFTDVVLEPCQGAYGLHLVYGPNEAGKSSSLRALRQVLFGIPGNSADNFIHPYPNLRIGATLRGSDGTVLEFTRRKGNKNTLRLADDKTVLDDAVLRAQLGGVDQGLFETMFGIDHETLVRGGQSIAKGGGDLGQVLFAAGSGIADLRAIQSGLEEEMEKLFKSGGSKPAINKALSDLDSVRKLLRGAQLPSAQWVERENSLKQARQRLAEIEQELHEAARERSRLQRILDALPLIADRKQLYAQRTPLGQVPILRTEFSGLRRDAVAELSNAEKNATGAVAAIDELNRQLAPGGDLGAPDAPRRMIAEAESIEQLREDLGSFRKAQRDLPTLQGKREQIQVDAQAMLLELRADLALDQAEQLRLTRKQQVEIQNLGNQQKSLAKDSEQAEKAIRDLAAQLQTTEEELAALEAVREIQELESSVRQALGEGDLDTQVQVAAEELCELEQRAAIGLRSLPLWSGTLPELEQAPIPTLETIDRFEAKLAAIDLKLASVAERHDDLQTEAAEIQHRFEQQQLLLAVPTEDDLSDARLRRDALRQQILDSWLGISEQPTPAPDSRILSDHYVQSVAAADELADRLRREADRVAVQAGLEADRRRCQRQLDALAIEREEASRLQTEQLQEWDGHWRPSGLRPLTPREMRAWVQQQRELCQTSETIRKQQRRVSELRQRQTELRHALNKGLQTVEQPPAHDSETLSAMIERSQAALARLQAVAETRRQFGKDLASLRKKLETARTASVEANSKLTEWLTQWRAAMSTLGLPEQALPAQAVEVIAQIGELLGKLKEVRTLTERIDGIERDAQQFAAAVQRVAERVAPELKAVAFAQATEELLDRLNQARAVQEKHEALQMQLKREADRLASAREVIQQMQGRLSALCQEAGCQEITDLPEAERLSTFASGLSEKIQGVEKLLLQLSGGATLGDFTSEAEAKDADALAVRINQLVDKGRELQGAKDGLLQTKGAEEELLKQMDGSAKAAEAAEDAQGLLAQIEASAQQYTRLRLAAAVLRDGIKRYRERNQGPVLERASAIFAALTLGSFSGLSIDFSEKGDPILVGVRASRIETVPVSGMSDGTADQMYLALRLASLETYLEKREPLPFIVDDLLINFDNERAVATLSELARFSTRTQIIFFTHHKHLVELAEAHLPAGTLFVHQLCAKRTTAAAASGA